MKKLLLVALLLAGCGGGGGEGDDVDINLLSCPEYCNYACDKALACIGESDPAGVCASDCMDAIIEQGTSNAQCASALDMVRDMNCSELWDMLASNMRSAIDSLGSLARRLAELA